MEGGLVNVTPTLETSDEESPARVAYTTSYAWQADSRIGVAVNPSK